MKVRIHSLNYLMLCRDRNLRQWNIFQWKDQIIQKIYLLLSKLDGKTLEMLKWFMIMITTYLRRNKLSNSNSMIIYQHSTRKLNSSYLQFRRRLISLKKLLILVMPFVNGDLYYNFHLSIDRHHPECRDNNRVKFNIWQRKLMQITVH